MILSHISLLAFAAAVAAQLADLPSCAVCDRAWLLFSDEMMANVGSSKNASRIYQRIVKHLTSAASVPMKLGSPGCLAASARAVSPATNEVMSAAFTSSVVELGLIHAYSGYCGRHSTLQNVRTQGPPCHGFTASPWPICLIFLMFSVDVEVPQVASCPGDSNSASAASGSASAASTRTAASSSASGSRSVSATTTSTSSLFPLFHIIFDAFDLLDF
jgi:hypothetical protein